MVNLITHRRGELCTPPVYCCSGDGDSCSGLSFVVAILLTILYFDREPYSWPLTMKVDDFFQPAQMEEWGRGHGDFRMAIELAGNKLLVYSCNVVLQEVVV